VDLREALIWLEGPQNKVSEALFSDLLGKPAAARAFRCDHDRYVMTPIEIASQLQQQARVMLTPEGARIKEDDFAGEPLLVAPGIVSREHRQLF
jgi:hypothetical protein